MKKRTAIDELRNEREEVFTRLNNLVEEAEGRGFTEDEKTKWRELGNRWAVLGSQIDEASKPNAAVSGKTASMYEFGVQLQNKKFFR